GACLERRTRSCAPTTLGPRRQRLGVLLAFLRRHLANRQRPVFDLLGDGFELQPALVLRTFALSAHGSASLSVDDSPPPTVALPARSAPRPAARPHRLGGGPVLRRTTSSGAIVRRCGGCPVFC